VHGHAGRGSRCLRSRARELPHDGARPARDRQSHDHRQVDHRAGELPGGSRVIATFLANNFGKKPHNFTIFGKKTKTIMPGHQARFTVTLTFRGQYPYKSTLDKGKKAFQGVFTVY
jgi:hypothetical protein